MKKLILIAVLAVFTASFSFGQIAFQEVAYDSLSNVDKALFKKYGNAYTYGQKVKVQADSITMIVKVTGIKKSRKMIVDTVTNTKSPEFSEQFMIVYMKGNKTLAFVSSDDPRKWGTTSCSIAAAMSRSGLTQSDDKGYVPQTKFDGQSICITEDW